MQKKKKKKIIKNLKLLIKVKKITNLLLNNYKIIKIIIKNNFIQ